MKHTPTPSPQLLAQSAQAAKIAGAKVGDPLPYCFGRVIATPKIITANDSGASLYLDLMWSVGEIEYIHGFHLEGITIGREDALNKAEHYNGTAGQAASPILTELFGSYDALPNIAHSVMFAYPGLSLDFKGIISGLKLYDPRDTSTAYSTNPALMLGRILTDCGYTMDATTWSAAANYCDELVGTTSPQGKRWEVGLQITERRQLEYWVKIWAQYCSCFIDFQGGSVYMVPDEPRASTHTVTADKMQSDVRVYRPGSSRIPERVAVNYQLLTMDFPYPSNPLRATDVINIRRTAETSSYSSAGVNTTLDLPGIQTFTMARRKAQEEYNKSQDGMTVEFTGFDDGLGLTLGDIGTITNAQYKLSAEDMVLVENKQVGPGRWRRKYAAYASGNYVDASYSETEYSLISLNNPYTPPDGPTPTLTEELVTEEVTYSRIKIQFSELEWAYMQDYRVLVTYTDADLNVVPVLDTHITHLGGFTVHTLYTGAVRYGVLYTVSIYCRSIVNAYSATPGVAYLTPAMGTIANLDVGDVTNMHVYILDGDAKYATTSEKTGSPLTGETWASRFGSTSPISTWSELLALNERFLENQIISSTFQTEVWDTGSLWTGLWTFADLNFTVWGTGWTHYVSLADDTVSPLSFSDYAGIPQSGLEAQYMKAKTTMVPSSPQVAGDGLHIKLPVPVIFQLGG